MGQASITVDILAKVRGWQEELAKLKASATKIDLGSDFGKSFSKAISNLDTQVNTMARNIAHKLTSDSGIDSFITKIGNIDTQFQNLGNKLSGLTFESLDPSYVTAELKELNEQLAQAQAALDLKVGEGFNEAVMQSGNLLNALERLGANPATVSLQQTGEILAAGIEKMKGKVTEADEELKRLSTSLSEIRTEAKSLSEEPITALDDLKAKAQELAGSQGDYGFKTVNLTAINSWIATTRASLLAAGTDLSDDSNAINQALAKLADSKTRDEVQTNLVALKTVLGDSKVKISLSDIGLGNIQSQTNKFIHDDLAALDNAKTALQSKLLELKIPQEQVDSIVFDFTELVKKGNWEQAIALLESNLETYKSTIEQKTAEIKAKEESLVGQIGVTKSVRRNAMATQASAEKALSGDYQQIVKDLQTKNANLEARVKELEGLIKGKQAEILGNVKDTGKGVSKESQTQFEQNAAAARMYKDELAQVQSREQLIGKIQGVVQRWFSIYAAVRMVSNAIKSVISTIKELDATITEIAIVTKMDQSDLWGQMDQYTTLARKYAASISGVYKVSQLYYQQGLGQSDVMALTEQTLKMARISGLDYAEATDYMTNAVRSFKMEMTDAQTVVDTYSAIAAKSATNVTELATAMSKTASSAESVGSSFQNTTAMMAVMIEATRESAENIGSAMKSIISRYGELKENKTGIDSEGEEYSLNKVDKALQSVGLSIHDANGEFREFDEVIMELAEKWDTIDKNTQRYIATVMAGNRQQSRFLALVSSYDRLKELSAEAADSEDAAQLQFLKTLDSVDAKTQQLQTSLQSLYVNSGLENMYKGILDVANNIIQSFTQMPTILNLPIPAIAKFSMAFMSLANIVTTIFGLIKTKISANVKAISGEVTSTNENTVNASQASYQQDVENYAAAARQKVQIEQQAQAQIKAAREGNAVDPSVIGAGKTRATGTAMGGKKGITRGQALAGVGLSLGGLAISGIADNMQAQTQTERNWKGGLSAFGSTLQGAGLGMSFAGPWGAAIGGVIGLATGALQALDIINESIDEKIDRVNKSIETTNNERIKAKDDLKTLTEYKKKYDEAQKTRYLDTEHEQEWIALNNEIVETYPELLGYIDAEGNAIADLGAAYDSLYGKKKDAYAQSLLDNIKSNLTSLSDMQIQMKGLVDGMSGRYLSKDRSSISWSNLAWQNYIPDELYQALGLDPGTFKLKPTAGRGNTLLVEKLEQVEQAATDSRGNYDIFQQLVEKYTGYDWASLMGYGVQFTDNSGQELITDTMNEGFMATCKRIDEQFGDYFDRINTYLSGEFSNLVSFYGEGLDFSDYSFLGDQFTKKLTQEWEAFQADVANKDLSPEEMLTKFWNTIPEIIEEANNTIFASTPDPKRLAKAEKFYTSQGEYSYNQIMNLADTLGENVSSFFTPEQITEMQDRVAEKLNKAFINISNIVDSAIDEGKVEHSAVLQQLPTIFRQLMEDIPYQFIDGFVTQYSELLTSGNFNKEGRVIAVSQLTNTLQSIENANIDQATKNQAYGILASADMSSLLSLRETETKLKDLGFDVDFSEIINVLIPNISAEIQVYENNLVTAFTSLSEALDKAAKGLSLKDAIAMAEDLGVTLESFEQIGDKFYIRDFAALQAKYNKKNAQFESDINSEIAEKRSDYTWLDNTQLIHQETARRQFDIDEFYGIQDEAERRAYYAQFAEVMQQQLPQYTYDYLMSAEGQAAYANKNFSQRTFAPTYQQVPVKSIGQIRDEQYERILADLVSKNGGVYTDELEQQAWDQASRERDEVLALADAGNFAAIYNDPRLQHWAQDVEDNYNGFGHYAEIGGINFDEVLSETNFELNGMAEMFGGNFDKMKEYVEMFRTELEESGINVDELLTYLQRYVDNGDFSIPFTDWLFDTLEEEARVVKEATAKATRYKLGSTALKAGKINDFMNVVLGSVDDATDKILQQMIEANSGHEQQGMREAARDQAIAQREKVITAIKTGNVEELWEDADLAEWADDIYELYGEVNKSVYDSITSSFKTGKYMTSTDATDWKFVELMDQGLVEKVGEHLYKVVGSYEDIVDQIMNDQSLDEETRAASLKTLFEEHNKDQISPISSLLKKEGVSYDEAERFAESLGRNASEAQTVMEEYGFKLNTLTGRYEAGTNTLQLIRDRIAELESNPDADREELNKLRAMVDDLEKQEKRRTTAAAFTDVFSNYDKISTESAAALATALGMTYEDVIKKYLSDNGNGTFSLDMSKVQELLQKGRDAIGDTLYNELLGQVAEFYDDGLTAIADASSFMSKGTDTVADMQKFVTDFNKKKGTSYTISNMFAWDDVLESYTLKPQYLQEYIEAQRIALKQQGFDDTFIDKYINKQLDDIRYSVNISDYYSSEIRGSGSKARKILENQMKASLIAQAKTYNQTVHDQIETQVTNDIRALETGGQAAVDVMRKYAENGELTVDQVEQAYKQRFTNLSNTMEALEGLQKNSIVDATTKKILQQIPGFKISSDGVVEQVGNLVLAYRRLYAQMKSTNVATVSELNAAYAKLLTAKDSKDIDAVDALNNAMGMTYDALGELLGKYNKDLETFMRNPSSFGLEKIGAGKVRIKDFSKFASEMGWKAGSEEYVSAYKTYNSSLIEYNKHITDEIKSEFDSLLNAKIGDEIDLTRIVSEFGEDKISALLTGYGATIKDGILTITETDYDKRAELYRKIGQLAVTNGAMLETEFQATMDQFEKQNKMNLIESYRSMIQGYSSISMETIRQYAAAVNKNYDDVIRNLGLTDNGDGTYAITLANLKALLDQGKEALGEEVYNQLMAEVASVMDNLISGISSSASFTTAGTKSQKEMVDFTNEFRKVTKNNSIETTDLFEYNDALSTFILKSDKFYEYLRAQSQELKNLGMSEEEISTYLTNEALNLVESNVDIQGYLQSAQRGKGSKSHATLRSQIEQALTTKWYGVSPDEATLDYYINAIEAGGKEAVKAVRELKGKNTTAEDIEAALNAGMNRINQVITDLEKGVGEIITEDSARILQAAGWGISSLGEGQYVIDSVGNMVAAYYTIYEEMEKTANHTTADLNKTYASLATAFDQKNIDTRDTLTNAFDVSYDTLAELINKYRPDVLLKNVLNNPGAYGLELTGFGSVNIMDFGQFAETMGWQTGSPEFLEYYSQYVDQLIETSDAHSGKALQEHAMDNINAIADAKVGDKVNVTYLSALFDKIDSTLLTKIMTQYGATLENGILTLNANADIPAIIAAVQRAATQAEALLPEQLAELSDTIAEFLAKIISLIKSGISGSLSNTDALDLQNWAKENGINNLQLIETADGLQLTAESMALVYDKMQQIDSLQAKSLLPAIKDSNNNYKTLAGTLREVAEFEQRTASTNPRLAEARNTAQKLYGAGGGTVPLDFELRPHVDKNGFIETVRSTSAGIEGAEVLVTPILPDGSELSDATAQSYAEKFAKGEIKLTTKLVDDSGKELDYTFKDIYMGTFDSVEAADAAAEAYHNYHEEVLNANEALKELNGTEQAQQNLLRDLVREHLVTADSMNFMSSALPEGIQAVVNAWENTATGMKALTEAEKNGYMGVQDFYNIITTASALMESAGRDFEVAGMNAAELMQSAGEHLKVVDGKLTVDLSSSGMNIVGSVGDLKNNLHDGIQELAKAEIEMLDAEIQVLEVLAAMEQLGDVDVNNNGIAFEIDDMFESQMVDGQNVRKFTKGMEDYLTNLEAYAMAHENVRNALEKIKLGNYSMWELVQSKDWAQWQAAGFTEQSLSQFLQTLTTMDWDVDNIQQQVADVLSGLQIGVSVELDNGLYVFTLTGEQFSFDWDNEEAMGNAKDAIEHWWGSDGKTTQAKVEELVQEYLTNKRADGTELPVDERWKVRMTLALASGEITLKDEGKGTWSGRYKGKEFKGSKEQVMDLIGQAMGYEEEGYTFEYDSENGTVKGKLSVGRSEITIDDTNAEREYYVEGHKAPFKSLEEAKGYLASKGEANASDAGRSFTFTNDQNESEKWNIYTDAETGFTYTVKQGDHPEYVYDGQRFKSYNALTGYLQFRNKGASGTPVEGEPYKIKFESGLEMEYQLDANEKDWKIVYTIGNHTFKNEAEATKYIEATKKPGAVVSDDKGTVTYSFMGYECVATFNTTAGTVSYKLTLPDGGVIEAGDEYSLKAAIATHFQPEGGEVTGETSGGVNYTLTTPGSVTVQVTTNSEGKVDAKITGADEIGGQTEEQVAEKVTAYMAENPAKVQASVEAESVTLSIGDATVTLAEGETVEVTDPIPTVTGKIDVLELTPSTVKIVNNSEENPDAGTVETDTTQTITITEKLVKDGVDEGLKETETQAQAVEASDPSVDVSETETPAKIAALLKEIWQQAFKIPNSRSISVSLTGESAIKTAISNILDEIKKVAKRWTVTFDAKKTGTWPAKANGWIQAQGNVGNAYASGNTLIGELGPELIVQKGKYFVAGQNGAEFVDLAPDAIVFNHLQTEQLLKHGMSSERGRAVTNERRAAAFAKGNISGPALASASAALAQLKALKAMWESLLNASVADMAGAGGGGGGGGGGGKDRAARASWIKEVERWYNLMQKIAQCEKDITHEETLRTKLNSDFRKNGKAYYDSQLQSLRLLQEQMVAQETLNISKREYFEQRREQLNTANGPFNQLYSFDENGQLKYNDNQQLKIGNGKTVTGGLAFLSEIMYRDEMNRPKYSAEEQYNMLVANGFEPFMHYDSSGGEILPPEEKEGEETDLTTWYTQSIQALFDHMDSQKEEMQNLHDSIEEGENKMLELQSDQNEILEEIRNNQMAVEQSVLDAIIDQRQRAIDNLSNERDALEKSTQKYIEGLSDALNKERDMYQQNESSEELNRMRRQLAILQRSGGSGSEIRSLQDNIRTKEKDTYFEEQQRQIDAIQEASDLQLERLDAQIDLMTETLEYEKDYGLLWEAVYQKMASTPEEITSFIMEENSKYWALSPLKTDTEFQNALFQAEQWVAFRESQNEQLSNIYAKTADGMTISEAVYGADGSWNIFTTAMTDLYGSQWSKLANEYKPIFQTQMAQTGDITKADVTTNATIKSELGSLGDKLVSALSKPDPVSVSPNVSSGGTDDGNNNNNNNNNQNNNKPSPNKPPTHTHNRNGGSRYVGSELHDFCTCGKDMGPRPGSTAAAPAKKVGGVASAIAAGLVQGAITLFNGVTDTIKKTTTTKINSTSLTKNGSIPGTSKRTLSADAGGMIDETQMALVHAKEAVLTPEQTSILRNDILGSNKNSLMNLLLDFRSAYSGLDGSTYSSINDNNSLIIEHASVEMNVSKIANDYDAQRAGEQAMSKILEIARKTSAKNSIRR